MRQQIPKLIPPIQKFPNRLPNRLPQTLQKILSWNFIGLYNAIEPLIVNFLYTPKYTSINPKEIFLQSFPFTHLVDI